MERMRRLRGEDYTQLPFPEAFRALAAHRPLCDACAQKHGYAFAATAGCDCGCHTLRSYRHLAHRTGLGRSQLHRLMTGMIAPTSAEIEAIAAEFKKSPHYFQEYRVARLCALLAEELARNPERSVMIVRKLGLEEAI
jgi:transcriptional regulator with XRE-family HTH domain